MTAATAAQEAFECDDVEAAKLQVRLPWRGAGALGPPDLVIPIFRCPDQ